VTTEDWSVLNSAAEFWCIFAIIAVIMLAVIVIREFW
jgi:hypothetical protein